MVVISYLDWQPVALALFYMWVLLIGFFVYEAASKAWHRLKIGIKILVAPVVVVFGAMDVLFDTVAGTIMFLELPGWLSGRYTFSQRCEYHYGDSGFRGVIADAFCFMLNSISPDHCIRK